MQLQSAAGRQSRKSSRPRCATTSPHSFHFCPHVIPRVAASVSLHVPSSDVSTHVFLAYMDVTTDAVQSTASARAGAGPSGAIHSQPEHSDNEGQDQDLRDTPFACNVCKRSYSRVDHLARHHRSRMSSIGWPSRGQNANALLNVSMLQKHNS